MVESDGERRSMVGAAVTTAGALVAVLGTFLPWLRSGARNRSSYAIFDLVERLGFAPGGVVAWSLRLWPLVPLTLVIASIAVWTMPFERRAVKPTMVLTVFVTLWVGGTALAVLAAPAAGLFRIGAGPWVTLFGSLVVAGGATVVAVSLRGSAASADA